MLVVDGKGLVENWNCLGAVSMEFWFSWSWLEQHSAAVVLQAAFRDGEPGSQHAWLSAEAESKPKMLRF